MLRILAWNICHRADAWRTVLQSGVDIALLQEACAPPSDLVHTLGFEADPGRTDGANAKRPWRTSVIRVNRKIERRHHEVGTIRDAQTGVLPVSNVGTIAAADVVDPATGEEFTVVSMYAPWERPHPATASNWIYADAAAHRIVSDLSSFIGQQSGHRIIAAGDLNILYGYGEHGNAYWAARYQTVFDRTAALGLRFVGPQWPNGRRVEPWPAELPPDSLNVPTFRTNKQTPATATRQLDFVFTSAAISDRVKVHAMNRLDEWGPSDHCRVLIQVVDSM